MEKHLHIICLNVPYPADFGGVFDLFYKLPVLQNLGVKIHLHCFEYGRGEQLELNKYCAQVHYYKRKSGPRAFSFKLPYIVSSRDDEALRERLLQDTHPIFIEGVHCTYLLNDERFKERKIFVRLHNVEHIYYHHLYKTTASIFRKLYSLRESMKLLKYEKSISNKAHFLAVTQKDVVDYKKLGSKRVEFLPIFLPPWEVCGMEGKGSFCLYHGNLAISENEKAVVWLIKEVFNDLNLPFVIAGKNPTAGLMRVAKKAENICVVANPNEAEMQDMIAKAHIHIIPSFNATGIKLKLVNALYNGRHVVVNNATIEGSGLAACCHVASDEQSFKALLKKLYPQPFSEADKDQRKCLLDGLFNNQANAKKLVELIWTN